jgi:hypothetical protein
MKRSRQGIQLLEIMVCLVIIVGPLYTVFSTMRSNALATQVNADQLVLDEVVSYFIERLCTTATAQLEGASTALLDQFLQEQAGALPEAVRDTYTARLSNLIRSKSLTVSKDVGDHENLYQFVVTVVSRTGVTARGVRIVHLADN